MQIIKVKSEKKYAPCERGDCEWKPPKKKSNYPFHTSTLSKRIIIITMNVLIRRGGGARTTAIRCKCACVQIFHNIFLEHITKIYFPFNARVCIFCFCVCIALFTNQFHYAIKHLMPRSSSAFLWNHIVVVVVVVNNWCCHLFLWQIFFVVAD